MLLELRVLSRGQLLFQRHLRRLRSRLRAQSGTQRLRQDSGGTFDLGQPLGYRSACVYSYGRHGHSVHLHSLSALQQVPPFLFLLVFLFLNNKIDCASCTTQHAGDNGLWTGVVLPAVDGHPHVLPDGHPDPGQTQHVHLQRFARRPRLRPLSLLQFHPDQDEPNLEDLQPRIESRHQAPVLHLAKVSNRHLLR